MKYTTDTERFQYEAEITDGLIRSVSVTVKDSSDWIRRMDLRDGDPLTELEHQWSRDSGKSHGSLKGLDGWSRNPRNLAAEREAKIKREHLVHGLTEPIHPVDECVVCYCISKVRR